MNSTLPITLPETTRAQVSIAERHSSSGKSLGHRMTLLGESGQTPAQRVKALGLKGKAKKDLMAKFFSGDNTSVAKTVAVTVLQACYERGMVPQTVDVTSKGFVMRGAMPPSSVDKSKVETMRQKAIAAMVKNGLTQEQAEAALKEA